MESVIRKKFYPNEKGYNKSGRIIHLGFSCRPFCFEGEIIKYIYLQGSEGNGVNIAFDLYYQPNFAKWKGSSGIKRWTTLKEAFAWLKEHKIRRIGKWDKVYKNDF